MKTTIPEGLEAVYERLDRLEESKKQYDIKAKELEIRIVETNSPKKRKKLQRILDKVRQHREEIERAIIKLQVAVKDLRESLNISKIILDVVKS